MNYTQFAQRIKNKYPQYQDIDDLELANKVISKYPQYQQQIEFDATPLEQTPQEQYIPDLGSQPEISQDENIIQQLLRLDKERVEKTKQRMRERGIEDPQVQTIPEIGKGALNLASYLPVAAPARLGRYAKGAYELVAPSLAGAGARYLGEREKGQDAKDALSTAAKQARAEIATGAALSPVLKLGKAGVKKLSQGIPDDLYKKAKQFSQKTSKPLVERIEQLKKLGQKATKSNKKIDENLEDMANKAAKENKDTANKISNTMTNLSTKFFEKNDKQKLANLIKKIPDTEIDELIESQHNKLIKKATPIIQDGGKKRNRESESLLSDFRKRFMTEKKSTRTRLLPSKKDPTVLERTKETITKYTPIKNRTTFFNEMRLISDKSTFGEGKKAVGQSYAKIHKNFNDFLKSKSPEYKEHKELGQLLVNFSKYKPDITDVYDANKIQKGIKETLDTFDKSPDPDSVKRIDDFLKQAKKYKFKTDINLEKYNKNLEAMKFEKSGIKGLTTEQIESLPAKTRENYLKNKDLAELTKEPLFTGTKKAEKVATDPSRMGRIMELLPPELRKNIEIEEAKRSYDALTSGLTASGEIPYVSPFVNQYFLASQIARKGLKSPALQGYAKKFAEGDTAITPEIIKAGAKVGARALPRQFFGKDQMPQTREELMQQRRQSQNVGQLRTLEQIKKERGL
jgi:hypothetical protein